MTVKGFKDITGEQALKKAQIRKIITEVFEKYGFEPAETPIIEYEEFVKGDNSNDDAVSDIFKLKDRGNRKLALRYEFTFQLKRLAKNKKLPYKRYQIGEVFRDEPITGNRFRQFTQCDADVVGSSVKDEAEVLVIAEKIFEKLGIKTTIYINNRKLLNEILNKQEISKNKEQVLRELDKIDKLSESEVKNNLKKYNAEGLIKILKNKEDYFKKFDSYSEIEELKKFCKYYGIKVVFQPSLVRGLGYYTGSIFEIKGNLKETIAGGGSYLVDGTESTGISFGLDRIAIDSGVKLNKIKTLVISINQDKKSIEIAEKLRKQEILCSLFLGKVSKALEYANSTGINYAVFIGEKEIKEGKFTLRDMKSGKESKLDFKDLVKKLG